MEKGTVDEPPLYNAIIAFLEENNVPHEVFVHEYVRTSEDASRVRGVELSQGAKALVLMTGSGTLVQCIVRAHRKIDLKKVKLLLGEKNVSLAHPDIVFKASGCTVGSVPPFGNLFMPPIPIYADTSMLDRDLMVFSAGSHHHSVRIHPEDWVRTVKPIVVDIGKDA